MTEAQSEYVSELTDDPLLTTDELSDLTDAEPQLTPMAYSGQDFDVEGLVRRLRTGDIKIPQFGHQDSEIETAGFQRSFVWKRPQMDRFIESLLLGYPIPAIFLVKQVDGLYLVLDGQQRLVTLMHFYDGVHEKKQFELSNVAKEFKGLTYSTLSREQRRTVDNAFIQATIVNTDGSVASLDAVYQIFERLNTGGTQLTPHEIRVALYAGPIIDLLEELNSDTSWRLIYGNRSPRIRDQELVLRILALYMDSEQYKRPLKSFLNSFTARNRKADDIALLDAVSLFKEATRILAAGPGTSAFRKASRQVNTAQAEAVMVGVMTALKRGLEITPGDATATVNDIAGDNEFDLATGRATADDEQVQTRLRVAVEKFATK